MALISVSNNALSNISVLPAAIPTGALTLIKSITASSSASIEFINGTSGVILDGTYSSYVFSFTDIHPATDNVNFTFNMSTDSGANYNVTKTTTTFIAYHLENDAAAGLQYETARDIAQGTDYQQICPAVGSDNDQHSTGYLQLFSLSSNTYTKHFISRTSSSHNGDYAVDFYTAGYGNTTSAVNAVRFQMSSGNIDDGTIKLYGVK